MLNYKTGLTGLIQHLYIRGIFSRLMSNTSRKLTIYSDRSQFLAFCASFVVVLCIWVNRVKLGHIQALVNATGDGLNVSDQLILNVLQVVAIF